MNHHLSYGLVDGKLHLKPGNVQYDYARRCDSVDRLVVDEQLNEFLHLFDVTKATINNIATLKCDDLSYASFSMLHFQDSQGPIDKISMNDFITTRRSPLGRHKKIKAKQSKSGVWALNSFKDSPTMTVGTPLKFLFKQDPEQHYVSSFPTGQIIRHENGTVLVDEKRDIIVGARCSQQISQATLDELMLVYKQIKEIRNFLVRGKEVANVCVNFAVTGLKQDNNTKLLMPHHPKKDMIAFQEQQMRMKLKSSFEKRIYPIVKHEFGWLFEPIRNWLEDHKVALFAHFVSGCTSGEMFWP